MPRVQIPTRQIGNFLGEGVRVQSFPKAKRMYYRDENKKWVAIGWTGRARRYILNADGGYTRTATFEFAVLDSQLTD